MRERALEPFLFLFNFPLYPIKKCILFENSPSIVYVCYKNIHVKLKLSEMFEFKILI